ncbi:MAG: hypothetical protein QOC95_737 [Thermoleophilaceae bacterium]|nr:hypothetical protein [Thermoleophilaceae bacterium]
MAARLRRGLGLRRSVDPEAGASEPVAERPAAGVASIRGLGEPPSAPREQAGEAELDTLRGELVRELDRMADGDDGSASFRRIAS